MAKVARGGEHGPTSPCTQTAGGQGPALPQSSCADGETEAGEGQVSGGAGGAEPGPAPSPPEAIAPLHVRRFAHLP